VSGEVFNGRVGVIIEVAPNRFYQYVLKEVQGSVNLDRGEPDTGGPFDALSPYVYGPTIATMSFTGRVVGQEEAERPVWIPAEPAGEIESAHVIGDAA
jgi:hypothetical protein